MTKKIAVNKVLSTLVACCEEIKDAIEYSKAFQNVEVIPEFIKSSVEQNAESFGLLHEEYEGLIKENMEDCFRENFLERLQLTEGLCLQNMTSLHMFISVMDGYLMNYIDGPDFLKPMITYPQPRETQ